MNLKPLKRKFFARNTEQVARELLGKIIVRQINKQKIMARITEVEMYRGENDLACHASRGRTPRTETLYGEPGYAYVYLIYGMYYCFNIVTEVKDFPSAVLLRACEPVSKGFDELSLVGPGRLCRELKITKELHNEDISKSKKLWVADDDFVVTKKEILSSPRIGVDYAKHCTSWPWRFYLKNSKAVSKLKTGSRIASDSRA